VEAEGIASIMATFNNTIITTPTSRATPWRGAGRQVGFKGFKSTPFAATVAAERARSHLCGGSMSACKVKVWRESAIRRSPTPDSWGIDPRRDADPAQRRPPKSAGFDVSRYIEASCKLLRREGAAVPQGRAA
jgi:ribosomal protein S11